MFNFIKTHMAQIASLFGAVCLIFVGGVLLGLHGRQPARFIGDTFETAVRLTTQFRNSISSMPREHLRERIHQGDGVVVSDPPRMQSGVTFLSGIFGNELGFRLVAADGTLVHKWPVNGFDLYPEEMKHKFHALIHGSHLYPNGDVIANVTGRGMIRIDACGKVIWRNREHTHHAIDVAADGVIWAPSWGPIYTEPSIHPDPFPFDNIKAFDPDSGKRLFDVDLVESLVNSGLTGLIQSAQREPSDLIHLNDVEILDPDMAPAFPMFEAGDLLISSRATQHILVLDGQDYKIKWRFGGPMHGQHDPDFNPDGTITLLDNGAAGEATAANGHLGNIGGSRILSINPATGDFRVLFEASEKNSFYTEQRGKHQLLTNGNILIAETDAGRAFEVTPDGDVVWSYINGYDEAQVGWLMSAARYPDSYRLIGDTICD
ncbi:MAG: hypothetical protein KDE08_02990 [Rhodobacteraceae bacterium]|nr:hypothetical protein [Paracoccaceae bacterium]